MDKDFIVITENETEVFEFDESEVIEVVNDNLEVIEIGEQGPSGGSITDYVRASTINAKGDLIVGDASAQPVRLPIGSNDYFLMVDSTQDRGYKFTKTLDGGTFE